MGIRPLIVVMAGPNGAGKSTAASALIPADVPYVNADEVAKGLPDYPSPKADIDAARLVVDTMAEYESRGESFAMETTLATRTLAQRVIRLRGAGYRFVIHFLWTPSAEFSIQRVAARVRAGGHSIPEETIRRRHAVGIQNFFQFYLPTADNWSVCENLGPAGVQVIAEGAGDTGPTVYDNSAWAAIRERGQK